MTKRRRTENTMTKRRTDNTMTKRKSTNKTLHRKLKPDGGLQCTGRGKQFLLH
jgi:hypothetical protein